MNKLLKESVLFHLKLDFGILLVFSTLITFLKLERVEIIQIVSSIKIVFYILAFNIVYGLFLENFLTAELIEQNNELEIKKKKTNKRLVLIQLGINIIIISTILFMTIGSSDFYLEVDKEAKFEKEFNNYMENFRKQNKSVKEDLDLILNDKNLLLKLKGLGIDTFSINLIKYPSNDEINKELDQQILIEMKKELDKRYIIIDSNIVDYQVLFQKYPHLKNVVDKNYSFDFDYEYELVLPGVNKTLNTADDGRYRYIGSSVYQRKLIHEYIYIEK